MQIAQSMAGYSLGSADLLRRAMGKKIRAEMDAQRKTFVEGAIARGVTPDKAEEVFDLMARFADYGFNKSHAAAYALVAYQTAWMKANHKEAFLAACMSLGIANTDRLASLRQDAARAGIARLLDHPPPPLAGYVALVQRLGLYPGSPAIIRAKLRPGDRLACCELHAEDYASLRQSFTRDPQVAVHHRDGWEAIDALLPPAQRRGLVLIDPPYESRDEFAQVLAALRCGKARFPGGIFAAWYPIKHRAPVRRFHQELRDSGLRDVIAAELWLREPADPGRLNGNGMIVLNPPFRFEAEAPAMLTALLERLGTREAGEGTDTIRLTDE